MPIAIMVELRTLNPEQLQTLAARGDAMPPHQPGGNERNDTQNREAAYKRRQAKADGSLLKRIAEQRRRGKDEEEIRRNLGLDKPIPSGEVALAMSKLATCSAIERGNDHILTNLLPAGTWRGPCPD